MARTMLFFGFNPDARADYRSAQRPQRGIENQLQGSAWHGQQTGVTVNSPTSRRKKPTAKYTRQLEMDIFEDGNAVDCVYPDPPDAEATPTNSVRNEAHQSPESSNETPNQPLEPEKASEFYDGEDSKENFGLINVSKYIVDKYCGDTNEESSEEYPLQPMHCSQYVFQSQTYTELEMDIFEDGNAVDCVYPDAPDSEATSTNSVRSEADQSPESSNETPNQPLEPEKASEFYDGEDSKENFGLRNVSIHIVDKYCGDTNEESSEEYPLQPMHCSQYVFQSQTYTGNEVPKQPVSGPSLMWQQNQTQPVYYLPINIQRQEYACHEAWHGNEVHKFPVSDPPLMWQQNQPQPVYNFPADFQTHGHAGLEAWHGNELTKLPVSDPSLMWQQYQPQPVYNFPAIFHRNEHAGLEAWHGNELPKLPVSNPSLMWQQNQLQPVYNFPAEQSHGHAGKKAFRGYGIPKLPMRA